MRIAVAGGGAAGFFAALAAREGNPDHEVTIYERSPEPLAKVVISGGGRCNVTHACFDPARLTEAYPRGGRELRGPFHRWQPADTVAWFEDRGVEIKTEPDGRMFPVTDRSRTISECLERAARAAGIPVRVRCGLAGAARRPGGGFDLRFADGSEAPCDALVLATGGNREGAGFRIAAGLGHTIVPPVPSLFTFAIRDPRLDGLAGLSSPDAEVSAPGPELRQRGPVLITHWGLSGPAVLRLSAWGARTLHDQGYRFDLEVAWVAGLAAEAAEARFRELRATEGRKQVRTWCPWELPQRLWASLVGHAGIADGTSWARLRGEEARRLARELTGGRYRVHGQSLHKEEFVTCGGVALDEVDFRTMESRIAPGLYLAGEVLDIDGITGGFNFQAAWTTGRIAGEALAAVRT